MDVLGVLGLVQMHWQSIMILGGTAVYVFGAVKERAYSKLFSIMLDMVRKVAVEELAGPEKRAAVVDAAFAKAPKWVFDIVSEEKAHELAEKAYQLLRGELKSNEVAKADEKK